jgi:hypothetical protein
MNPSILFTPAWSRWLTGWLVLMGGLSEILLQKPVNPAPDVDKETNNELSD